MAGQSFDSFMAYNARVNNLVKNAYPNSKDYLVDPNELLGVETPKIVNHVYGRSYNSVRYQFRMGNHPRNDKLMNDSARQDYFMWLIRWVKDTYEKETCEEMAGKRVPAISVNLRLAKHYNSNTTIV